VPVRYIRHRGRTIGRGGRTRRHGRFAGEAAAALAEAGLTDDARAKIAGIVERWPGDVRARMLAGDALAMLGDVEAALAQFQAALPLAQEAKDFKAIQDLSTRIFRLTHPRCRRDGAAPPVPLQADPVAAQGQAITAVQASGPVPRRDAPAKTAPRREAALEAEAPAGSLPGAVVEQGGLAQLLEPHRLRGRERAISELPQRRPAPQVQGRPQQPGKVSICDLTNLGSEICLRTTLHAPLAAKSILADEDNPPGESPLATTTPLQGCHDLALTVKTTRTAL